MKVFVAGPRKISNLNSKIEERLNNIYKSKITVVVGDANGIDKAIQSFYNNLKYKNVNIYATKGNARNNIGNWLVKNVDVDSNVKGFDYYAAKDLKMAEDADYGLMIWNGKSKGTLNNIINLINRKKTTVVFFTPENMFYTIKEYKHLYNLISETNMDTQILFKKLINKNNRNNQVGISDLSILNNNI